MFWLVKRAFILYVVTLMLCASSASASQNECTKLEGYAAEVVTDYLDSWKNMHLAYKEFKQCSEEALGEGFSEADARLMADHWANHTQVLPMIAVDPDFEAWIISHLDETDNYDDLRKIDHLAQTACPIHAHKFCSMVHTQIESLAHE